MGGVSCWFLKNYFTKNRTIFFSIFISLSMLFYKYYIELGIFNTQIHFVS